MEFGIETLQRCEGLKGLARRLVGHSAFLGLERTFPHRVNKSIPVCFQDVHELNEVRCTSVLGDLESKPRNILTLSYRGLRVVWMTGQQVAKIEMCVSSWT